MTFNQPQEQLCEVDLAINPSSLRVPNKVH